MRPHATEDCQSLRLFFLSALLVVWGGPAQAQTAFAPVALPDPESRAVQAASLAADESRLVTFYCHYDPSVNFDYGYVRDWNGTSWSDSVGGNVTRECSVPNVAVHGVWTLGTYVDDTLEMGCFVDEDGYTKFGCTVFDVPYLVKQKDPRPAFAFGQPYVSFNTYDGLLRNYAYAKCVHVGYNCEGLPEESGGLGYRGSSASYPVIAGDGSTMYLASRSVDEAGHGCIFVQKYLRSGRVTGSLGGCFYLGESPRNLEIAMRDGHPVVAWIDTYNGTPTLWIIEWDGTQWKYLGSGEGASSPMRLSVSGGNVYVAFSSPDQAVNVGKFDGTEWSSLPNPLDAISGTGGRFAGLAVYHGAAHVALVVGATLKVIRLENLPPSPPTALAQFRANGVTSLPVGGATPDGTLVFAGTLSDPDAGQQLRLQIEVRALADGAFTGFTHESAPVHSGEVARITIDGFTNDTYHWRARTVDSMGAASEWASFGGNPDSAADFQIAQGNSAPTLTFTGEVGYSSDGVEPNSSTEGTTFAFRVRYTDADNDPPLAGYPKLHVLQDGSEIVGSPFPMTLISGTHATGVIYARSQVLAAGNYTYSFQAFDSKRGPAKGAATSSHTGPTVTPPTFTLSIAIGGSAGGSVTSNPGGISCGATCAGSFSSDTPVTLMASASPEGTFTQWRGDACNGSKSLTCQVTLRAATTVTAVFSKTFTDGTLRAGVTPIKAVHFAELREAINTLRSHSGSLGAFPWTDTTLIPGSTPITRQHLIDLRTALDQAYTAAARSHTAYTDSAITAGTTLIKASHFDELRAFVRALE